MKVHLDSRLIRLNFAYKQSIAFITNVILSAGNFGKIKFVVLSFSIILRFTFSN